MYELKDNKKASDSQKKIYKALRKVLLKKSLDKVTVSDIKNECNISRSTFYRNFNNVSEILVVIFEYFYTQYISIRTTQNNQLLFFFQYWYWHRDLIRILADQNRGIIEDCIKRNDKTLAKNPYLLDLKVAVFCSILCKWSELKKATPEEMEKKTKSMLNKKCLSLLID
jgi:AcrR family transcriptional regulator